MPLKMVAMLLSVLFLSSNKETLYNLLNTCTQQVRRPCLSVYCVLHLHVIMRTRLCQAKETLRNEWEIKKK
jgi:hypothetical protein